MSLNQADVGIGSAAAAASSRICRVRRRRCRIRLLNDTDGLELQAGSRQKPRTKSWRCVEPLLFERNENLAQTKPNPKTTPGRFLLHRLFQPQRCVCILRQNVAANKKNSRKPSYIYRVFSYHERNYRFYRKPTSLRTTLKKKIPASDEIRCLAAHPSCGALSRRRLNRITLFIAYCPSWPDGRFR